MVVSPTIPREYIHGRTHLPFSGSHGACKSLSFPRPAVPCSVLEPVTARVRTNLTIRQPNRYRLRQARRTKPVGLLWRDESMPPCLPGRRLSPSHHASCACNSLLARRLARLHLLIEVEFAQGR